MAESIFVTSPAGPGGGELSPGAGSTAFSVGSVPFANSSGQLGNDTSLYWDTTGKQLQLKVAANANVGQRFMWGTSAKFQQQFDGGVSAFRMFINRGGSLTEIARATTVTDIKWYTSNGKAMSFWNSSGQVAFGTTVTTATLSAASTVNGIRFAAVGTTGGTTPIFVCESTNTTSKIGFFGATPTTRAAAFTAGAGTTATRAIPTTASTAIGGTYSSADVVGVAQALNNLISVVHNLVTDLQGFGLIG